MKWFSMLLGTCMLFCSSLHAQTPDFIRDNKNIVNNIFPFWDSNSHSQMMYAPGDFNILPQNGNITKIYFRTFYFEGSFAYGYGAEFHHIKIGFKQTTDVQFNNNTFHTGLTTAFTTTSFIQIFPVNVSKDGWVEFNLTTPFTYDNTKTLIVDIQFEGKQGNLNSWSDSTTNYKTLSTRVPGALQGNLSHLWNLFGMDITPTSACGGVPVAGDVTWIRTGTCGSNTYNLDLAGNSKANGLSFQWQRSSSAGGPFTNIGVAASSPATSITNTGNYWYRAAVSCGANSSYTAPVLLTPNQYLSAGIYTVNSAKPTAGNNFRNFQAAVEAMKCGITGPVTIDVVPNSGLYNERFSLPQIPNASATNTITFKGNGNQMCYATFNLQHARAIMDINGADYVTIDSFRFKFASRTNEYASYFYAGNFIQLRKDANYVTIRNCIFDSSMYYYNYWTSNWGTSGIRIDDDTMTAPTYFPRSFATSCDNVLIENNLFRARGIFAFGDTANDGGKNLMIRNNRFGEGNYGPYNYNYDQNGIWLLGINNAIVEKNFFENNNNGNGYSRGFYCDYYSHHVRFTKNIIADSNSYSNSYTNYIAGKNISVDNNLFMGRGSGISVGAGDSIYIQYNTLAKGFIYLDYYSGGNLWVTNNTLKSFTRWSGGWWNLISDHNNFDSSIVLFSGSTTTPIAYNLATWQTLSGQDLNSTNVNPMFASPATLDYRPTNPAMDNHGIPIAGITDDITGIIRNTITPDIGAFEFGVLTCPPVTNLTASSITATSATLNWNISGGFNNFLYVLDQTPGNPAVTGSPITGTTFLASPIQPFTTYYFHVRTDCTGMLANWVTISFTTPCLMPGTAISPAGPINLCYNTSANLSVPAYANATYQWKRNGVNIPGATTASYIATTAGSYTVQAAMGSCASLSTAPVIIIANAQPVITAAGSTAICQGNTVALNAPTGSTYQWLRNGTIIVGAVNNSYNAGLAGSYRAIVANGSCTDTSNTINISVNQYPPNSVTPTGPVSFCDNQPFTMTAVANTAYTYQWSNNGIPIPAAVTNNYTTTISGNYTVTIANGGCTSTSSPVSVTSLITPIAIADAVGNTIFCNNGSVFMTSTPGVGLTYKWMRNNMTIPGATGISYTATQEGIFKAIVSNGSCTDTSLDLEVIFNAYPRPAIVQIGNYLHTVNAYPAYQWNKNGLQIPFANARDYTPIADGSYVVVVTDTGGCQGSSNVITISSLGINGLEGGNLAVYPNPVNSILYINYQASVFASIFSMDGKLVMNEREVVGQLDVSFLNGGIYTLRLKDKNGALLAVKRISKIP